MGIGYTMYKLFYMKKAGIDDTFCRYESKPKIKPKPLYTTTNQKIKKNITQSLNYFFLAAQNTIVYFFWFCRTVDKVKWVPNGTFIFILVPANTKCAYITKNYLEKDWTLEKSQELLKEGMEFVKYPRII